MENRLQIFCNEHLSSGKTLLLSWKTTCHRQKTSASLHPPSIYLSHGFSLLDKNYRKSVEFFSSNQFSLPPLTSPLEVYIQIVPLPLPSVLTEVHLHYSSLSIGRLNILWGGSSMEVDFIRYLCFSPNLDHDFRQVPNYRGSLRPQSCWNSPI